MIIGFTGTQQGMTDFQKDFLFKILKEMGCTEFHHGDCIGADLEANHIALGAGADIFSIHPPNNWHKRAFCFDPEMETKYVKVITEFKSIGTLSVRWCPTKPYLERNQDIINDTALLIAAPKEFHHTLRSGTWATIRYAWKNKKPVTIIPPVSRMEEKEELFEGTSGIKTLDKLER